MTEESEEVLPDDTAALHPRLWMVDQFDGEIDGEKKFHKSLVQFRNNADLEDKWPFIIASWGPLDPGFSSILAAYDDLELMYVERGDNIHIYKESEKGSRFIRGLKRGMQILRKDQTEKFETELELIAKINKDRLGSEIELDDVIQEMKEDPLGDRV
jgi:hypothetical protein